MFQPSQVSTRNFVSEGATDIIFRILGNLETLDTSSLVHMGHKVNMCLTRGYPSIGPKVQKEVSESVPSRSTFQPSEQMCWKTWP